MIDKASYIAVGDSLDNIDEWRIIYKDEDGVLETCFWFGDDLFLAGRNKAAVIKNARLGGCKIAFVERNFSRPRSTEILMMDITLLNMETGNIRKISCPDGGVKSIEEGRLIVLCSRHDVVKNKKDLPILINIDIESGERKTLAYGKMGSEEIIDVFKTPSGRIVFRTYEGDKIYYPEKLDEFMF